MSRITKPHQSSRKPDRESLTSADSFSADSAFASYIMLPLMHESFSGRKDDVTRFAAKMGEPWKRRIWEYSDYSDIVNQAVLGTDNAIGSSYSMEADAILRLCGFDGGTTFQVVDQSDEGNAYDFRFKRANLYYFKTNIAFLSILIEYSDIRTLEAICGSGYCTTSSTLQASLDSKPYAAFSMKRIVDSVMADLGLILFAGDGGKSADNVLINATTYTIALLRNEGHIVDKAKLLQMCYNLHEGIELTQNNDYNESEELRYTVARRDYAKGGYRWGICATYRNIAQVITKVEANGLPYQLEDDLTPMILIVLYEKYSCIYFGKIIQGSNKISVSKRIMRLMLEFKAYGTIPSVDISPWYNYNSFFENIIACYDVASSIANIDSSLQIITEMSREREAVKMSTITSVITVFGLLSIVCDAVDIVDMVMNGNTVKVLTIVGSSLTVLLIMLFAIVRKRG